MANRDMNRPSTSQIIGRNGNPVRRHHLTALTGRSQENGKQPLPAGMRAKGTPWATGGNANRRSRCGKQCGGPSKTETRATVRSSNRTAGYLSRGPETRISKKDLCFHASCSSRHNGPDTRTATTKMSTEIKGGKCGTDTQWDTNLKTEGELALGDDTGEPEGRGAA